MKRLGAWLLMSMVGSARAHGERTSAGALTEGAQVLFSEPSCVLLLVGLGLFVAQAGAGRQGPAVRGGVAGLFVGTLLVGAGLTIDLALPLLVLALTLGALAALARPWAAWLHLLLAAAAASGGVLMLAPPPGTELAQRLSWLVGVLMCTSLVFAGLLSVLRLMMGRKQTEVKRLLLRVVGAWVATGALLTVTLSLQLA